MSEDLLQILVGALGSLVLLFGAGFIALWRSTFRASLQALTTALDLLAQKFDRHAAEDREAHAKYATLAERLANHGERIKALSDWKHEHCEPAARYTDYLQREKPWEAREQRK